MKFISFWRFVALLPIILSYVFSHAQNINDEISNWFLEERFIIADKNDDALLDHSEMEAYNNEFVYYLTDRNYDLTDKNGDGFLSFQEIHARKKTEYLFRYNMDIREIRNLTRRYPFLPKADEAYLKDNPVLVASLFSNLVWMYQNAELAEEIYKNKIWMDLHIDAKIALHKNLRWMASNPAAARHMYRDRNATQYLPQFLGWRASHKNLIRKYPRLEQFYELEFVPASIRINR